MASVKAIIRPSKKSGTHHIYLVITIDRFPLYISLKQAIEPQFWDKNKGCTKPGNKNSTFLNRLIERKIQEVKDIFLKFELDNKKITLEDFKNAYNATKPKEAATEKHQKFNDFFASELQIKRASLSNVAYRNYNGTLNKLNEFNKSLTFTDVNYDFLTRFEEFLLKTCKLSRVTVHKHLKTLRTFVILAEKKALLEKNPYKFFKIKQGQSFMYFLSQAEIMAINELQGLTEGQLNARDMFLFACFTGLRFSDLLDLKWIDIHEKTIDNEKHHFIIKSMLKTQTAVSIPLIPEAVAILEKRKGISDTAVFKYISNQKYNKHLHAIESKCKIKQPITSHVARHTFATMGLTKGIPLEVISSLLGHSSVKTTQIYAKIIDIKKIDEMKKLKIL